MIDINIQTLSHELGLSISGVIHLKDTFEEQVKSEMRLLYLAHLKGAIEELINRKKITEAMERIKDMGGVAATLVNRGNMRPYSIKLRPLKGYAHSASVRGHDTGATIYYNPDNPEMILRTAIAHELGHIFMQEYLQCDDTEEAADTFAYIAMQDKNNFYTDVCAKYDAKTERGLLDIVKQLHC